MGMALLDGRLGSGLKSKLGMGPDGDKKGLARGVRDGIEVGMVCWIVGGRHVVSAWSCHSSEVSLR